jgi:SAM-dependent methyltransferase
MKHTLILVMLIHSLWASAQEHRHPHANEHMHSHDFETLVDRFEHTERDRWQQPEKVVQLLGDLTGKKVMDLGSGSGYFSFRLHEAGAHVICADVDERFLGYIEERKNQLDRIGRARIETRHVPYDAPGLQPREVDLVFTVNTYHHIDDRADYFRHVKEGLRPGGQLVVIDFFKADTPMGPPRDMKVDHATVREELMAAGFAKISVDTNTLFYQYIITAE